MSNKLKALSFCAASALAASIMVVPAFAADGERPKIVISTYLATDAQVEVRHKYLDEPLAEAFPDYDIEFKMYNDRQSLMVEVAGGGGPDVLNLDGPTDVAQFADADRVRPMDDYAEKYGWQDIIYKWAYDSCIYKDHLYSLPTSFEGMVMYYNNDVFEENGWEIPQTLEELEALMPVIQEAGIMPISFGNADYQGAVDWLYSTFTSCYAGPDKVKAVMEGEIPYTDDAIKGSLQKMVDWWDAGYIGDKATQTITTQDLLAFFATGRAAMIIDGTWASSELLTNYPDCNWSSFMMPADPEIGEILPFATGGGYAINKNSKYPDETVEVLNWLFTEKENHYKSIVEASYQPYPIADFDMTRLEGMDQKLYGQYALLMDAQADNKIGYCSWTFYPADMRTYMNENTDSVFLGALSLDDYLATAQTYVDVALEAGTVPVLP